MHAFVIRSAGPDDVPALISLDSFAAPDNGRAAEIVAWVASGWCFCAEENGRLAGYGVVHPYFFARPFLEMLMVAQTDRRRGAASALLAHAITLGQGAALWTSTNQSNAAMRALLAGSGFVQCGIIEGLDETDPELIFRFTP